MGLIYYCDKGRHLVCKPYSVENLHTMAEDLGIKRCWYRPGNKGRRHPHYDIPLKDIERIKGLCNVVSSKEILQIIKSEFND
jgi:hypothetical protein